MSVTLSNVLRLSRPGVYMHWCPGCRSRHLVHAGVPNDHGFQWAFDGDIWKPTFSPSVHIQWDEPIARGDELAQQRAELLAGVRREIPTTRVSQCHYTLTAGVLVFLQDCRHDLAGATVDLPEFPR